MHKDINSWNEVTLELAERLEALQGKNTVEQDLGLIEIVKGVDYAELLELTVPEVGRHLAGLSWMSEPIPLSEPKDITFNGLEFELVKDTGKLTYAQFVDMQSALSVNDKAAVLASAYRPKGGKYNQGYDMEAFTEYLRKTVPIGQYRAFFLSMSDVTMSSCRDMADCLAKRGDKRMRMAMSEVQTLLDGLGFLDE